MLHPLSKIKITKYFNYKPRFNGIYLRDNLLGAYAINLIDKKVKESIELNTAMYFGCFGIEVLNKKRY